MGQKYDRWGVVAIEPVLEAIRAYLAFKQGLRSTPAPGVIELLGKPVRITSLRLQTFALHPPVCAEPTCGCKATHFALERTFTGNGTPSGVRYHLNLYGRDSKGQEVLFTHDHTLARALGGLDDLSNTKPMCSPCNLAKSKGEHALLRRLRAERGLNPHTGILDAESVSPHSSRRNQKLLESFRLQATLHGLTEEAYRQHCESRHASPRTVPTGPFLAAHPRRASLLGLSEAGYSVFNRDEARYQVQFNAALRHAQPLEEQGTGIAVRDALFEHMVRLAAEKKQPLAVFRAHVEAEAQVCRPADGNLARSLKHVNQAKRLGLSPIGLDHFRDRYPVRPEVRPRRRALA